jgi:hypothetical protein
MLKRWKEEVEELAGYVQFLVDEMYSLGVIEDDPEGPAYCFPDGCVWYVSEERIMKNG